MNGKQFQEYLNAVHINLIGLTATKGEEYKRREPNQFANFERLAKEMNLTREQVLMVYMAKHLNSITTFVRDAAANDNRVYAEPIEGRIDDTILYLILLRGMITGPVRSMHNVNRLVPTDIEGNELAFNPVGGTDGLPQRVPLSELVPVESSYRDSYPGPECPPPAASVAPGADARMAAHWGADEAVNPGIETRSQMMRRIHVEKGYGTAEEALMLWPDKLGSDPESFCPVAAEYNSTIVYRDMLLDPLADVRSPPSRMFLNDVPVGVVPTGSLDQIQLMVHRWAEKTFGKGREDKAWRKMFEEMGETIKAPDDPLEWADLFIILFDLAEIHGINLVEAIHRKMAINEGREWTETHGIMTHVKE
jgi:hypothetical protein